jgi:hypothetical protein
MDAAKRDAEIRRLTGNVRYAGVNQVWGQMCEGWENTYSHENWYDEMTYQYFPRKLVPWTYPADDQRDIVLSVNKVFPEWFVGTLFNFLVSLTKWWIPPEKFAQHAHLPKYQSMQYICCIWEHEVQSFEKREVQRALRICNYIGRIVKNTDKTPGLLKRLTELRLYLDELDQFLSVTEKRVAPSVPEVGSSAGIRDSLLRLKSQCHVLDNLDKSSI